MDKISFIANGKEISEGGAIKLSINFIKGKSGTLKVASDLVNGDGSTEEVEVDARLYTNELPIIFNAIKQLETLSIDANDCFTYTFPFKLARGHGFPYVFDFSLEDNSLLTLT